MCLKKLFSWALGPIFLLLLAACGKPQPNRAAGQDSAPSESIDIKRNTVCFPGEQQQQGACLELADLDELSRKDYGYQDPFKAPNFPKHLNPDQYLQPLYLADLNSASANLPISPSFSLEEFMAKRKGRYGILSRKTLSAVQGIRDTIESPLFITSGYRSPGYNRDVSGSAQWSRHMYGDAVDFFARDLSLNELAEFCANRGAGFFQIYKSHVHCDWRSNPLDEKYYGVPHHPTALMKNNIKLYEHNSYIEVSKSGPLRVLEANHPTPEDPEPLVYHWKAWNKNGTITEHHESTWALPAAEFSHLERVEVVVGGSVRLSLDL